MAIEELKDQSQLHFLVIPLGSSGHYIPTIDMAKLLAQHGVKITIVTTPVSAIRFGSVLDQAIQSGLPIDFLKFPFPSTEFGLPEGCETIDDLPHMGLIMALLSAYSTQQQHVEQYIEKLNPRPHCIISDSFLIWPNETAKKFQIPRIIFDSMNCFTQMCNHILYLTKVHESVEESESFVLPGLPDRIELTRCQLPSVFNAPDLKGMSDYSEKIRISELEAYGVVINSFQELEPGYVDEFQKVRGGKAWCIGPLSLCHTDARETAERGNKSSINKNECLKWLDSQENGSVIYVCLGSISQIHPDQLVQLALALESSKNPFIWVVRAGNRTNIIEKWIDDEGFEERTKDRALLIRGWAPQLLVLSHPSIGAFLTHCGSNSLVEGICAGVPMITWPQYQEQFYNEKFVVNVLKTGVSIGEQKKPRMAMTSEEISKAIEIVMEQGSEGEERRKRAKELGEMAYQAIEDGGSSYRNVTRLIQDIRNHAISTKST
uniref:Glycosyltransferase n=1 Tax=Eschenbachia blinii TaxID=1408201 RepID=A0A6S4LUR0_9ASTR|nr:UGT73C [Eschenbachia blinii]